MMGCVGGFPQAYDQFRGHIERWLFPEFMDFLYFVKTFFSLRVFSAGTMITVLVAFFFSFFPSLLFGYSMKECVKPTLGQGVASRDRPRSRNEMRLSFYDSGWHVPITVYDYVPCTIPSIRI